MQPAMVLPVLAGVGRVVVGEPRRGAAGLRRELGAAYDAYARRVPMLVPFPRG